MPIRFPCENPECGRRVVAPDGAGGKKARCPQCGAVQYVPDPDPSGEVSETSLLGLLEGEAAAPPPASVPAWMTCPECRTQFPGQNTLCPDCGWVNAARFGAPPGAGPAVVPPAKVGMPPSPGAGIPRQRAPGSIGALAVDCLKSITYGFTNTGSVFKLVLYAAILSFLLRIALGFLAPFLLHHEIGQVLFTLADVAIGVAMGGYYLRYFLDSAISSLEGADQAPNTPDWDLRELYMTGVRGIGIILLYVVPVITLPLLPLGLMALAYTNDGRAYDVFWAFRAAGRRPGALVMCWLILLLWLAGMAAGVFVVVLGMLALIGALMLGGGCMEILLGFLLALCIGGVIASVGVMFIMAQFRCVGMLGHHFPDLLESLPAERNKSAEGAFLLTGVILTTVITYLLVTRV